MTRKHLWTTVALLCTSAFASAQSWTSSYELGLNAAKATNWAEARKAFLQAIANRPEDSSKPTTLPGPVTEQRRWRNGAAYSPNFLAAYSAYQLGLRSKGDESTGHLTAAANELEAVLAKGWFSREAFFVLNIVYGKLGNAEKRSELSKKFNANQDKLTWRVDTEVVSPEELALIYPGGTVPSANPSTPSTKLPTVDSAPLGGPVKVVSTKYALIIANAESRLEGGKIPYALTNAAVLKDSLVNNAGYAVENVEVIANATADNIKKVAAALNSRMTEEGTLFLYFIGNGTNIDGKDYLAGVDTEIPTDTSSMIAKADLYKLFVEKGASIFAFYESSRPIVNGRYFGAELPSIGRISQAHATIPGESIYSIFRNGRTVGIYTDAVAGVLGDFRSNSIPVNEFGWQVFYRVRRGSAGGTGGGSRQTPTLPVVLLMSSDARF